MNDTFSPKILVIDDEEKFLKTLGRSLSRAGIVEPWLETDPENAVSWLEDGIDVDVAIIDVRMPKMDGLDVLEAIKRISPDTECLMLTGMNDSDIAMQCINKGAYDYLTKPVTNTDLMVTLNNALEHKRLKNTIDINKEQFPTGFEIGDAFRPIVTRSSSVFKILKEAELHAASNVPVLVTGESGTGKELLVQAIHHASSRSARPFTPINMASVSESLFEAEFFGHTKGAYTGAEQDRKGYLEMSHGGTVFLDEIGYLSPILQGKLLRVIQEGEMFKLGKSHTHKVDVRFIAATNADLEDMVRAERFRNDLYYRLKGAWLHLPPLRQRKDDIPLLVETFLHEFGPPTGVPAVDKTVMTMLMEYKWPGNIRELRSVVQTAVNISKGEMITVASLPEYFRNFNAGKDQSSKSNSGAPPITTLAEAEKNHILRAYEYTNQNLTRTAQILGVSRSTLQRKMKIFNS